MDPNQQQQPVPQPPIAPAPIAPQAPMPGMPMQPMQPMGYPTPPPNAQGSNRKVLMYVMIGLGVFVVITIILVIVFASKHKPTASTNTQSTSSSSQSTNSSNGSSASYYQTKAQDAERQTDIMSLQTQLEAYYANNGYYPTFTNMNDANFRSSQLQQADPSIFKDPTGSTEQLATAPSKGVYAYEVTPAGCTNTTTATECSGYTLVATLSNGQQYTKTDLNSFSSSSSFGSSSSN